MTDKIVFTLDGKQVAANAGETIWDVAKREGTKIPHLCHVDLPGYRVDGNCRACMVEIKGERVLTASCIRKPTAGMDVQTQSTRAVKSREMVFELLASNMRPREARARQSGAVLGMGVLDGHRRQQALCVEVRRRARNGRARSFQSRDRGESRCVHFVRRVRARVP